MKGINNWSFKPYHPPLYGDEQIYVSRIAPLRNSVIINWFTEDGSGGEFVVNYKKTADIKYSILHTSDTKIIIDGLDENCDYEFYITNTVSKSRVRLFRTGYVPGIVVNYLHPKDDVYKFSGQYLCSPSLLKLDDGTLLASMDVFEGNAPQNLTLIYKSTDGGQTWEHLTELFPCFWGKLFLHKGAVYMFAISTEYGDVLIGRSDDGGRTFGMPTVISRGSCSNKQAGFHKAPMPLTSNNGRLWTAVDYGAWSIENKHASALFSISEDDDLLVAENWLITEPVLYNSDWQGTVRGKSAGCLEGNAVVTPEGDVVNVLRYQTNGCEPSYGKAMILKADTENPEKPLEFYKVIDFSGNLSKFDILYDEISGQYVSIITGNEKNQGRNILSLAASKNLYDWYTVCDLIDYTHENPQYAGFQYISFLIDGNDILYLSRTALNEPHNFHDANYSTFHKIENFRSLLK